MEVCSRFRVRSTRILHLFTAVSLPFFTMLVLFQAPFTMVRMAAFVVSLLWSPILSVSAMVSASWFDFLLMRYASLADKLDKAEAE
jgi:hypothetical protein